MLSLSLVQLDRVRHQLAESQAQWRSERARLEERIRQLEQQVADGERAAPRYRDSLSPSPSSRRARGSGDGSSASSSAGGAASPRSVQTADADTELGQTMTAAQHFGGGAADSASASAHDYANNTTTGSSKRPTLGRAASAKLLRANSRGSYAAMHGLTAGGGGSDASASATAPISPTRPGGSLDVRPSLPSSIPASAAAVAPSSKQSRSVTFASESDGPSARSRDTDDSSTLLDAQLPRLLPLKQLREAIDSIYASKTRFDMKCAQAGQPRETMEQVP